MALTKSLTRLDPPTLQTMSEGTERESLLALSQRKLNALGLPVCYIDLDQHYRFVNRAFLDWTGRAQGEVIGREVAEVDGRDLFQLYHAYLQAALSGERVSFERQLTSVKRSAFWIRVDYYPDRGPRGEVRGVLSTFTDVDNIKHLELEAGEREHRLRMVTDSVGLPIFYFDRALRLRFANKPYGKYIGGEVDDLLGQLLKNFVATDALAEMQSYMERAFAGATVSYERRERASSGELRWVRITLFPDREPGGNTGGAFAVINDIEDDVRIREALKAQEAQLRLFADNIPEPVVYVDMEGNYSFVNDAFLHLVGIPREEVIGKSVKEVLGAEVFDLQQPYVDRAAKGESVTFEREHIDINCRQRWLRNSIFPDMNFDGTIKGYYIVGHDITDLQQAQNALAARESQLRAIMDGVPAPVAYLDRDERCQYVNKPFLQYFGLSAEQVRALRLRDVVGHGIYASAQAMLSRALHGESTSFDRLVPGAGGAKRWMTIRVVPDATPSGEVHGAFVLMNDIHGLKQAQEALRASEAELRLIMDNVPARVAYIDREYRYRFLNRHNEEWLSESRKELTGRPVAEVLGDARAGQLQPLLTRVLAGETISTELLLAQPNDEQRWESIHLAPNRDAEGNVIGIYAAHTDIHDQKRNEEALHRANWMLSSHINNTPLAVLEWNRDFRLIRWSPQAEKIFGWRADEVHDISISGSQLTHKADREQVVEVMNKLMTGDEPRSTGIIRNHRKDGETIWCEWYHSCLLDEQGRIASILSFVQDVSSRIQAEERLQYLATRDALTGLPNRLLLQERLTQAIAQAKRSGRRIGVMFIDLDRFKNVNDTLGHRIGDELLKRVTASLSEALRETDLLARLGGDEFMVIVEDFGDPVVLNLVAQKLQEAVAQPFQIEEHDIYVTSSIGIAVYPDDSDDPEGLLKHADVAMYRSKELGRNTYQFFDADLAARRLNQHTLEKALRIAVKENKLVLHYQPVIRIADKAVVGAEALLRWSDPEHGEIPPQVFIPLAEESGLIHVLGDWVLRSAAEQCVVWRKAGLPLMVSVNLSGRQFYRDDLAQRISQIVRTAGCEPSWIELEVTESSLLHDLEAIRKVLHRLRKEGFSVAIDDFGTGYSSLSHLNTSRSIL